MRLARRIGSSSLKKDGYCSLAGSLLSVGIVVGASLFEYQDDGLWWLDAALAVGICMALLLYGGFTLVNNALKGNRWWTVAFWTTAGRGGASMLEEHEMQRYASAVEVGHSNGPGGSGAGARAAEADSCAAVAGMPAAAAVNPRLASSDVPAASTG